MRTASDGFDRWGYTKRQFNAMLEARVASKTRRELGAIPKATKQPTIREATTAGHGATTDAYRYLLSDETVARLEMG